MKAVLVFALTIALVFTASGQGRDAVALSEEAVRLSPNSAEAWYKLGVAKFSRIATENAKAAFERAIELDPDHIDAYFALGVWHLYPKRSCALGSWLSKSDTDYSAQLALAYLNKAIKLKPNHPRAFVWLGRAYKRLKLDQDAARAYEKAIEQETEELFVYLDLASIYEESFRFDDVLLLYRRAIAMGEQLLKVGNSGFLSNSESSSNLLLDIPLRSTYYRLAALYVELGRDFEALETYKEIIRLGLDQDDTHFKIGLLFVKFGDKDSAENAYSTLAGRAANQKHDGTRKQLKKEAKDLRKRILAM